jgi:hypothetical protein
MAGLGRAALDLDQPHATRAASAATTFSAALEREGGLQRHLRDAGKDAQAKEAGSSGPA